MRATILNPRSLYSLAFGAALVVGMIAGQAHAAEGDVPDRDYTSSNLSSKKKGKTVNQRVAALDNGPDIYAPVPSSEVDFNRYQVPPSTKSAMHVEASASTWTPNSFSDYSYVGTSGFKSDAAKISLNMWTGSWEMKGIDVAPKFGFAYDQLIQSGQLPIFGQTINSTEVMNLLSLRAGLEITPQNDFFGQLQPFADLSLLPTWAESPESGVNDGTSQGYLSLEGVLGLNWHIPHLGPMLGVQKIGLEIGVEGTQGVFGSPLSGVGLMAGTRVEL